MATTTTQAITGPEAWRGEELARSTDWIREIPSSVVSMPNSRALPPRFDVLWGSIEAGALRGGIAQPASTSRGGTS